MLPEEADDATANQSHFEEFAGWKFRSTRNTALAPGYSVRLWQRETRYTLIHLSRLGAAAGGNRRATPTHITVQATVAGPKLPFYRTRKRCRGTHLYPGRALFAQLRARFARLGHCVQQKIRSFAGKTAFNSLGTLIAYSLEIRCPAFGGESNPLPK